MNSAKIILGLCKNSSNVATRSYMGGPKLSNKLSMIRNRDFKTKIVTADEALSIVNSDTDIYIHNHASTPTELLQALCRRVDSANIDNIRVSHILLGGEVPFANEKYSKKIRSNSLFISPSLRGGVNKGDADYTPIFLVDIPNLYISGAMNVDIALISVSEPDERGFCTMGTNVDCSLAGAESAKKIIALINPSVPRTYGTSVIHVSNIDYFVRTERPIYARTAIEEPSEIEKRIGKIIAENLVDNGATLQLGIGAIPDSALLAMNSHKDLGIHTEMFSDGVIELLRRGIINNTKKTLLPGKTVSSFAFGTPEFYKAIDDNNEFFFAPCNWTNHIDIVRQNSKMTSINSALEIDLTGQIVSDSIGSKFFSGFGGQVDFMTATPQAYDGQGKAIIAIPSRTNKGQTKIVPYLTQGSGVVTTRAHARFVVTEFGIAQLFGKNVRQRAYELINIAHPDDRESLEKAAFERLKCMPSL